MSKRRDLRHSINMLLKHVNTGSFSTKATRENNLMIIADDIFRTGLKLTHINQIGEKHINKVVELWKKDGLDTGTIKNRMAAIRYVCDILNKPDIVKSNAEYGIGSRTTIAVESRAIVDISFHKIEDQHLKISLELQRAFGLRREECLKIRPHLADKGNMLCLYPSWCKGGRGRFIPILTVEQRYWLNEAKKLAQKIDHSMIPKGKSYKTQVSLYDKQTQRADLKNLHGLRHAYAQKRYLELTGWLCPIAGGPHVKDLTKDQKEIDHRARILITEELGHSRKSVTNSYLSR